MNGKNTQTINKGGGWKQKLTFVASVMALGADKISLCPVKRQRSNSVLLLLIPVGERNRRKLQKWGGDDDFSACGTSSNYAERISANIKWIVNERNKLVHPGQRWKAATKMHKAGLGFPFFASHTQHAIISQRSKHRKEIQFDRERRVFIRNSIKWQFSQQLVPK